MKDLYEWHQDDAGQWKLRDMAGNHRGGISWPVGISGYKLSWTILPVNYEHEQCKQSLVTANAMSIDAAKREAVDAVVAMDVELMNSLHGRHFKHRGRETVYKVTGFSRDEKDNVINVLYQQENRSFDLPWSRPIHKFLDGRFERLEQFTS